MEENQIATLEQKPHTTYQVEKDEKGHLIRVLRQPGDVPIPLDCEDQRFCDFLAYASHHMYPRPEIPPYGSLPPDTYYFSDMDRLVKHCKHFGLLIYTSRDASNERQLIDTSNYPFYLGGGDRTLTALPIAVAPTEGKMQISQNGVVRAASKTFMTLRLLQALQKELKHGDENSPLRRLSTWTIDRAFVYLDVSDFSKYEPGQEVLIINSIVNILEDPDYWIAQLAESARKSIEAMLCIGDGYIFVLKNPEQATFFAAYLARLTEILVARKQTPVEFHFRMGVHFGPVYSFWDPGRNDWNYIGDGINGGQRVLQAVGKDQDDVVFVSGRVYEWLTAEDRGQNPCHDIVKALRNRGRKADKHGNLWRVYEVDHPRLATMALPGSLGSFQMPQ
jgi:hypothetical protein